MYIKLVVMKQENLWPTSFSHVKKTVASAVSQVSEFPRIYRFLFWNIILVIWKMQASIENIKTHMNPALYISEYLHCVILYSLF